MEQVDKLTQIRLISEEDLIIHKTAFKGLLNDNMHINFTHIDNFDEFVNDSYQNMLKFLRNGSAILIGSFNKNEMIGFLWAYQREFFGEQRIHIGHIIVNVNERSKGIGTKLLNYLEKIAKEKNLNKIELITSADNENTLEFYKVKGFSEVRIQLEKEIR
jgi:ribosomal protein S18 acetylase RimI-like enzyme